MSREILRRLVPVGIAVAVLTSGSVAFAGSTSGPAVEAQAVSGVNADKVDGFDANSLTRVAIHSRNAFSTNALTPIVSTSIDAPTAGYVYATGVATVASTGSCPTGCFVDHRLRDLTSGEASAPQETSVTDDLDATVTITWVFPVLHGRHVIVLEGGDPDNAQWGSPTVTLLYVPFDGKGQRYRP
jgi:hypothetical protein